MVDPQLTAGSADQPRSPAGAVGANGLVGSSEDEPSDMGPEGPQRSPAPLLERIRRDRQDLEARITKLKGYIQASSDMMSQLKDAPDMKERYEKLLATRADLVQNAVNLQQLLNKLKQSESRASALAGRERALAAETAAQNESAFTELAQELPAEAVADLDPEDRVNYEKKRELLKRINQSHEKLRAMETEQQRLRMMKENVEWKLAEARASRLGLAERAEEMLQDMPGGAVHPAAAATNFESTAAPDRSALETLNARVAALQSLPLEALDAATAEQLQGRLSQLAEKRQQLDGLAEQLRQLQLQSQLEDRPDDSLPSGDGARPDSPVSREQAEFMEQHVAAISGQRQRLHQLEATVADIRTTLELQSSAEEQQPQLQQDQDRGEQLLQEQEQVLQRRAQQVAEQKEQLERMKQLMTSVEEAHASGQRLSDAVPHQLTELLASVNQLDKQLPAAADDQPQPGPADVNVQPDSQSQSQAEEYVQVLRNLQQSVDSLSSMQLDQ